MCFTGNKPKGKPAIDSASSSEDSALKIWLEQHRAIREEINVHIKNQQTTLQWTSVAIAALLIFAFNLWSDGHKDWSLFFLTIIFPSCSIMFLHIWLSSVAFMMTNSRYLVHIEEALEPYLPNNDAVLFERWLRRSGKHITFGYVSGVSIYIGITLFAHIVANYIYWGTNVIPDSSTGWKILFSLSTLAFNIGIILNTRRLAKTYILES